MNIPEHWLWVGFSVLVIGLIALDLVVSRNRHEAMPIKTALAWSAFWIGISLAFGAGVWWVRGSEQGIQFFTGYLLEKSLSVDNLFVFLIIFQQFRVPAGEQHRVLTWGILGALVLRGLMIFAGVELIQHYHWVLYVFGGFLVYTGARTLFHKREEGPQSLEKGRMVRFLERVLPFVPRYEGGRFLTHENGKRTGTLLLLVLVVIEATDLIFAVDSIPAILAITDDPFIVFSSNVLAILGLRALFFAVAALLERLRYLQLGLGFILILIGAKMLVADLVSIPALISFAVTMGVLAVTVIASLLAPRRPVRISDPSGA
jgi:tellurite resistance protein TerC